MKKVLLATTMLVAGASIAAADVTLSGDARMGLISNFEDTTTPFAESDLIFTSRARVTFTLSAETDSGLAFGGSFRADNAGNASVGQAGNVFVSGAFGRLSMGDVDGAAQSATGHVAGVGLTGLGDLNESTFLGAGDMTNTAEPTALYEYSAGDFTFYVSATNPDALVDTTVAAPNNFIAQMKAYALGARYTFGDYTVGLGYETLSGFSQAAGAFVPNTPDNVDVDHIVLKLTGTVAGFELQGLIGQADGDVSGLVAAGAAPGTTMLNNAKQYAASVSYTTGALTGSVFYTDDSALGGTTAYGLGGTYDLGGGASVVAGIAEDKDANAGGGATAFDIGLNFTF